MTGIPELMPAVRALESGDIQVALNQIETPLRDNPDNPEVLNVCGLIKLRAGQIAGALDCFRRLVTHPESTSQAHMFLAICCEHLGFFYEGIEQCRLALEKQPNALDIMLHAARLNEKLGRYDEEICWYQRALNIFPESGDAFGGITSATQRLLKKAEQRYYHNFGPILIANQGHSAGMFVAAELIRQLRLLPSRYMLTEGKGRLDYLALEELVQKGGLAREHLEPREDNLIMLNESGLKKMVITVRDPRQGIFSNTLWLEHLYQLAQLPDARKHDLPLHLTLVPKGFFESNFSQRVDLMIEEDLPYVVSWLNRWIKFADDPNTKVEILFARHDDLKRDEPAYFNRILDFYGIDRSLFSDRIRQPKKGDNGKPGEHAYRKGSNQEWREQMSPKQISRANELVPDEILQRFSWER